MLLNAYAVIRYVVSSGLSMNNTSHGIGSSANAVGKVDLRRINATVQSVAGGEG